MGIPARSLEVWENETVWLSLDQVAELFQRDKSTITRHIKNIFEEGELTREAVVANFATTATDGKPYQVDYYKDNNSVNHATDIATMIGSRTGAVRRSWKDNRLTDR